MGVREKGASVSPNWDVYIPHTCVGRFGGALGRASPNGWPDSRGRRFLSLEIVFLLARCQGECRTRSAKPLRSRCSWTRMPASGVRRGQRRRALVTQRGESMISISKLYCGGTADSDGLRYGHGGQGPTGRRRRAARLQDRGRATAGHRLERHPNLQPPLHPLLYRFRRQEVRGRADHRGRQGPHPGSGRTSRSPPSSSPAASRWPGPTSSTWSRTPAPSASGRPSPPTAR